MNRLLASARLYLDPRMVVLFFLGFSSGLPRLLIYSTLAFWLLEEGLSIAAVGLFAATSVPYNLKFLWAPLLDRVRIPGLSRWLGIRRSWILVTQLGLAASIAAMAFTHPGTNPGLMAILAIVVATWSASQDVVIDAYRVERLEDREQGAGAAVAVFGYRMAMLVASAGALYIATWLENWSMTYLIMASLMGVGMITVLVCAEPTVERPVHNTFAAQFRDAVVGPFKNLMVRRGWFAFLAFVVLYKLGEGLAGTMTNPFLVSLEFTKIEIANIAKTYGLLASIAGVFAGGMIVRSLGIVRALWIGGLLQMVSNLMFVLQAQVGHDTTLLIATIGIENLTGGLGTAALVAYLSALCNRTYTATQYAVLTALSSLASTLFSGSSGLIAEAMGWAPYFLFTTVAALPGLVLLWAIARKQMTGLTQP
jgi:MFS transporter, PAT family, beta-lactamase induction signal transducer AmpG